MSSLKIKVGCDPELFIKKDGGFVSAHGVIQGNKKAPYAVKNGAVQVDGMALEFNINPAESSEEFTENIKKVRASLSRMVKRKLGSGVEILAIPTAEFGEAYINSQPEEAKELGCDPDYSCYTGKANPRPDGSKSFRTGAGHVHVGWCEELVDPHDPEHFEACIMLTKQLDLSLGLGSLLFDHDTKRRELYGDFGTFRPKPYGVEYRTLSNAWLNREENIKWVYDTTIKATKDLLRGDDYSRHSIANRILKDAVTGKDRKYDNNNVLDALYRMGLTAPKPSIDIVNVISVPEINNKLVFVSSKDCGGILLTRMTDGKVGNTTKVFLDKIKDGNIEARRNLAKFFDFTVDNLFNK